MQAPHTRRDCGTQQCIEQQCNAQQCGEKQRYCGEQQEVKMHHPQVREQKIQETKNVVAADVMPIAFKCLQQLDMLLERHYSQAGDTSTNDAGTNASTTGSHP